MRYNNTRLELRVDEIKTLHPKDKIKMFWTCDADDR